MIILCKPIFKILKILPLPYIFIYEYFEEKIFKYLIETAIVVNILRNRKTSPESRLINQPTLTTLHIILS